MDWAKQELKPLDLVRIQTVPLSKLYIADKFFDSLRVDYKEFDRWYARVAQEGRTAWLVDSPTTTLAALCIYKIESEGEKVTDAGQTFAGRFLKLCTFKVAERGIRYGERLLYAAFQFALSNNLGSIYVQIRRGKHLELVKLLERFGFYELGPYNEDVSYVKDMTRGVVPIVSASRRVNLDYAIMHYPYHLDGKEIGKFIISMPSGIHDRIFLDARNQSLAIPALDKPVVGDTNAIRKAIFINICNRSVHAGDLLFFYVKGDDCYVDCMGVVENVVFCTKTWKLDEQLEARLPYTSSRIVELLAERNAMVIEFRLIQYLTNPITRKKFSSLGFDTNHKDVRRIPEEVYRNGIKPFLKPYGVSADPCVCNSVRGDNPERQKVQYQSFLDAMDKLKGMLKRFRRH